MLLLANQLDELLEVCRDHSIDRLAVVESWHDVESVALRHQIVSGYSVVYLPRPRLSSCSDLSDRAMCRSRNSANSCRHQLPKTSG